jgi:hypothetical protein
LRSLFRKGEGKKGYENKRKNRGSSGNGLHFALASWSADSSFAFVFPVARLHIEAGERGVENPPGEFLPSPAVSLVALPPEVG